MQANGVRSEFATSTTVRWRRSAGARRLAVVLTALVALLGPLATADPATAWIPRDNACTNYPTSATIAVPIDHVPVIYRAALNNAIAAWQNWAEVTGVTVLAVDSAIPAGAIPVTFVEQPSIVPSAGENAYARAGQRCKTDPGTGGPASARLVVSTSLMSAASERLKQNVFTHELGHIFGLGDNEFQATCGTIMH